MAGSELSRRFKNIKETLFQAGAAKDKLSSQVDAAAVEVESLKKQLAQANATCELEKKKNADLTSQLENE